MRPRVLLGIDRPGWSLDRIADQLERYLSDDFDFTRAYFAPPASLELPVWKEDYQVVVAMHWPALSLMREVLTGLTDAVGVACVYDHYAFRASPTVFHQAACLADMIVVANDKMLTEMVEVAGMPPRKVRVCKDGVDTQLFPRCRCQRGHGMKPLVGWCGNSEGSGEDGKGLDIIREVCRREGYALLVADTAHGEVIPHEKMVEEFYSRIDVYACASEHEGTPNPVLEALACRVPVASTDVGVAAEAGAVIARRRTPEAIAVAIETALGLGAAGPLMDFIGMGQWSWASRIEAWRSALKEVLG